MACLLEAAPAPRAAGGPAGRATLLQKGPDMTISPTKAALAEEVKRVICEQLGVGPAQVTREMRFQEDLGADSLDLVELVMKLEEVFEITIPDDEAQKIRTVGDASDYVVRRRTGQGG